MLGRTIVAMFATKHQQMTHKVVGCCVGGPRGAMATLENALSSVFGHQSFASEKDLSKLGLICEAKSKEEALTQSLKQLMTQQMMERLLFKEQVRRGCLTAPKGCTVLMYVYSKCWILPCKTGVCVVTICLRVL